MPRHAKDDLFNNFLNTSRKIHLSLRDRAFRLAMWTEECAKLSPRHLCGVMWEDEVVQVQVQRTVIVNLDQFVPDCVDKARLAVRREVAISPADLGAFQDALDIGGTSRDGRDTHTGRP